MLSYISRLKIVLATAGVIFLFFGFRDLYYQSQTPADYNSMLEADFKKGMVVEGYVYSNLGAFEENYTTRNGVKTGNSKYNYMIPVGEIQYMGLLNDTSALGAELDAQTDATYSYMMGESISGPQPVYFKGRVMEMSGETKGYMQDFMLDIGFTTEELDQYILPYYIKCENYDNWAGWLIAGFVFLLIDGAIILVPIITAKKKKDVIFANENVDVNSVDTVLQNDFDRYQVETSDTYNTVMNETQTNEFKEEETTYKSAFDDLDMTSNTTPTSGLGMGVVDDYVKKEEKTKSGLSLKLKD